MGKRKAAAKPPTRKRMYKLDMVFSCPFCNHGSSVERRMRLRRVRWTAAVAELLHGLLQFQGDRASKVRRRYRRTEGRERRKGRGVAALTVNLRLRRTPVRGGAPRMAPTRAYGAAAELWELGHLDRRPKVMHIGYVLVSSKHVHTKYCHDLSCCWLDLKYYLSNQRFFLF